MCRVQKEMQALIGAAGAISSPGTTFSPDAHGFSLSEPSTRPNSISEKKDDKKKNSAHGKSGITETTRSNNSSGSYSYATSSNSSSHDHHDALHPHVPFHPKNHHHIHSDLHGSDHDDSMYHGSDSDTPSVDHNHGDTLGSLPLSRLMEHTKLTDHELCSTDEEAELHHAHNTAAAPIRISISSNNKSEFALQLPSGGSSPERQSQPASATSAASSAAPFSEPKDPSDPTIIDPALDAELVVISQQLLETAKKTLDQLKVCFVLFRLGLQYVCVHSCGISILLTALCIPLLL